VATTTWNGATPIATVTVDWQDAQRRVETTTTEGGRTWIRAVQADRLGRPVSIVQHLVCTLLLAMVYPASMRR